MRCCARRIIDRRSDRVGTTRLAIPHELKGTQELLTQTSVSSHQTSCLAELLEDRYSCRAFLPDPVPRALIDEALRLAQRTPSSCNSQPWQAIITEGDATHRFREALYEYAASHDALADPDTDIAFPESYDGMYKARQRECGLALYQSVGIARGDREASRRQALRNFRLFDAPHVMILTNDRNLGVYGAIDCGAYAAMFTLAATSLGYAAISQAAIAACTNFVRQYFALSEDRQIICGISFGFPDVAHPVNSFRTTRASIEEAVTYV